MKCIKKYEKNNEINKEKPVDRRQGFLDSMKKLTAIDNESFTQIFWCCWAMNQPEDIPEEFFCEIYKQIKEAMDKVKANF